MTDRASLPDFELPATGNQRFQLSAFKNHPFVLYFYPRDNTPGCTDESLQFRDLHPEFVKSEVVIAKAASRASGVASRSPGTRRKCSTTRGPPAFNPFFNQPVPTRCPTIP